MHELTLMAGLLRRVAEEARNAGAQRVSVIRIEVGELSGVDSRLLAPAFQTLAIDPLIAGAKLEIATVPLEASCGPCGQTFRLKDFRFACPKCGSGQTRVIAGEDIVLESITVEEADMDPIEICS